MMLLKNNPMRAVRLNKNLLEGNWNKANKLEGAKILRTCEIQSVNNYLFSN